MKKSLTPALALVALTVFTGLSVVQGAQQKSPQKDPPASGQTVPPILICKRPAIPAHDEGVDRCHGDWHLADNTNNWTYNALQGPDRFTRSNGKSGERSCTKCPHGGSVQQDFQGLKDWCVKHVPDQSAATATPSCPPGFSWTPGLNLCFRPGTPAQILHVFDRCHGDWHPTDNTNNWTYNALQGADRFTRSNGNSGERPCTKCPHGGSVQQDFQGLKDWCVASEPAHPSATTAGTCPAGYTLVLQ